MKTLIKCLLASSLIASSGFATANVELVTNGGFELGAAPATGFSTLVQGSSALSGWNVIGSIDWVSSSYWDTPDNSAHSLDLNGMSYGGVSQTLNTVTNQTYTLSFDYAGNPEGNAYSSIKDLFAIAIGSTPGVAGHYTFDTANTSNQNMGWVHEELSFVASGSQTTLSFLSMPGSFTHPYYGAALDNVSVVSAAPVPEPETYAMLGLGLMALAMFTRRNKC